MLGLTRTAGIYTYFIQNIVIPARAPAPPPAPEPAEEPAPEEEPVAPPPPPPAAEEEEFPWFYHQPRRRGYQRPRGCRCTKKAFVANGCNGQWCTKKWTSINGDYTPSLGPLLTWRKLTEKYIVAQAVAGFFGTLGNYRKAICAEARIVNAGYARRRSDREQRQRQR